MVTLNLKDGSTLKLDLSQAGDRGRFNSLGQRLSSKNSDIVTAIWFSQEGQAVTLPIPTQRFRRVFFYCEELIEKASQENRGVIVHVQADEVRLTATAYRRQGGMIRLELRHTGKHRFSPGRSEQ